MDSNTNHSKTQFTAGGVRALTTVQTRPESLLEFYHNLGLNVIPCLPESKKPAISWRGYQENNYTGTFPDNCNYAIICGKSSQNLVVLDFDFADTDLICKIIPNVFEDTLTVLTGSEKYHVYIRVPELPNRTRRLNLNGYHLDMQSQGAYVVCPPSIHQDTGKQYQIISKAETIKTFDLREVFARIEKLGFRVTAGKVDEIIQGVEKGDRNIAAFKYARFLLTRIKLEPHTVIFEMKRWNQQNKPPLTDAEMETVWRSALRYGNQKGKAEFANKKGKVIKYVR